MLLNYVVKDYGWGKKYNDSIISKYLKSNGQREQIYQRYSELWIGSHPSGKSIYKTTGEMIIDDLPYLFKVLTIDKPLSIQSHPDKTNATRLHQLDPKHYPDGNHKPELAIALTDFEAFCGFIDMETYNKWIDKYPFLKEAFSDSNDMKTIFHHYMYVDKHIIDNVIIQLKLVLPLDDILWRLERHFPNDRGLLSRFLLQYYCLPKGMSLFIPPNVPHFYVSGDIIEIMSTSDNVIRGGLTNKYIDTQNLCDTLTYEQGRFHVQYPIKKYFDPQKPEYYIVYQPPVQEFKIIYVELKKNETVSYTMKPSNLLFIESGTCTINDSLYNMGNALFYTNEEHIHLNTNNDNVSIWIVEIPSK